MRYELFDYQREATIECLRRLARGRRDWTDDGERSAFALSAVTGSGKTVIATAVIEALIHGSADLGIEQDSRAVFLWVTDDPALNRQTRNKMLAASDLLDPGRLVELNDGFLESELAPGRVHFLNIQQLSKTAGFSKGGSNLRRYSGWDILRHTITAKDRDLYLVLDEAHRGMSSAKDRPTIVRRIINGESGLNPPVPVVWGISATIERFNTAMAATGNVRTRYPPVSIAIDKVRASGIIKDQINLDESDETGDFTVTLLRGAVDANLDFEKRWAAYAEAESEPLVKPVLVVQVADKPSDAHLRELVSVIESQWLGLGKHAMVNVFGEHTDLLIGERNVRYVAPEMIQGNDDIRVVLAKTAISTGWDCPRAEVLFSERTAKDATSIAQVMGRMVRSPLARRIATDDALNSVTCLLPRFDRGALDKITAELTRPGEVGEVIDVVVNAALFARNRHLDPALFEFVETLPSLPPPDTLANPLRRAMALIQLLTDDASSKALLPDAGAAFDEKMHARLDGLAAQNKKQVAANVKNLETMDYHRRTIDVTGETLGSSTRTVDTAIADIDRQTRRVVNSLKEGVGKRYLAYRVGSEGNTDELTIRTEVAALLLVEGVVDAVEEAADRWVQDRFAEFAVEIKNTTGATRAAFMRVKEQASNQEETTIELPLTLKVPTKTSNKPDAADQPTFANHLFADEGGMFPAKLNDWEGTVVEVELARPSFVAWYRNPSRAGISSLRIGYRDDADQWGSLQVDFLIVSRRDNGQLAASIVDPHGDHLADALAKLKGLADYAERFGDRFVRVVSVTQGTDGSLRSLDLLDTKVRKAVRGFSGAKVTALFDSKTAEPYI
ncbi:MAG: DEAD/DEAH box helicase [Acidimicrobiia bacterium]